MTLTSQQFETLADAWVFSLYGVRLAAMCEEHQSQIRSECKTLFDMFLPLHRTMVIEECAQLIDIRVSNMPMGRKSESDYGDGFFDATVECSNAIHALATQETKP